MEANYPGKIPLCEANHGPVYVPYFGDGDEFHMDSTSPSCRIYMALKVNARTT
ncbi:MAG: hypothetical protein U0X87_14770 [Anaerolineales bacterium]